MRWISSYLRRHRVGIGLYAVFAAVFAGVFSLYHLPLDPVCYCLELCAAVAFLVLLVDGVRYRRRAGELERQRKAVKNGVEFLPDPEDGIERLYQELLRSSQEERIRQVAELMREKTDLTDYFTLWVHQVKTPIAAMRLLLQEEAGRLERFGAARQEERAGRHEWDADGSIAWLGEQKQEMEAELFEVEQYVGMALQYIRLKSGTNDFVLREYEVDGIVRQAVRKYAPMFIRKKLSLSYEPLGMKAVTDEKWMVFVLEQILGNAVKYTASGSISIYRENSCLTVEDTGIGILEEDLPRIFEKGYTGYNGRSDKKASGIGLYLVKGILDKLGHKVSVESEAGKGTKVRLMF